MRLIPGGPEGVPSLTRGHGQRHSVHYKSSGGIETRLGSRNTYFTPTKRPDDVRNSFIIYIHEDSTVNLTFTFVYRCVPKHVLSSVVETSTSGF